MDEIKRMFTVFSIYVLVFLDKLFGWDKTPEIEVKKPKSDNIPLKPKETPTTPNNANKSEFPPMIVKWAGAIGCWEGAKKDSNNMGNLKYSSLTASWGAKKGRPALDGGNFCQFDTPEQGKKALCNFLLLGCQGELKISHPKPCTFEQFTIRFAGNPPKGYINGIAKMLDVPLTVDIADFIK